MHYGTKYSPDNIMLMCNAAIKVGDVLLKSLEFIARRETSKQKQ